MLTIVLSSCKHFFMTDKRHVILGDLSTHISYNTGKCHVYAGVFLVNVYFWFGKPLKRILILNKLINLYLYSVCLTWEYFRVKHTQYLQLVISTMSEKCNYHRKYVCLQKNNWCEFLENLRKNLSSIHFHLVSIESQIPIIQ